MELELLLEPYEQLDPERLLLEGSRRHKFLVYEERFSQLPLRDRYYLLFRLENFRKWLFSKAKHFGEKYWSTERVGILKDAVRLQIIPQDNLDDLTDRQEIIAELLRLLDLSSLDQLDEAREAIAKEVAAQEAAARKYLVFLEPTLFSSQSDLGMTATQLRPQQADPPRGIFWWYETNAA